LFPSQKVLDAVEQTGSSLLRFKQRKAAAGGGQQQQQAEEAATESDEAKIRAQLCYDANFVRQRLQVGKGNNKVGTEKFRCGKYANYFYFKN
jgi:hypothetical protein